MAKSKAKKQEEIKQLVENFQNAKSVVFSTYRGLKVNDVVAFRKTLRENGVSYTVSKKTLIKLALKEAKYEDVNVDNMKEEVAVSFGREDEVAPAKLLADFVKEHKTVEMLGGILEGRFISDEEVVSLSKIPSREQLLAKLVGSLSSPMSGFVNVLQGNTRGLVQVLKQISEQKV